MLTLRLEQICLRREVARFFFFSFFREGHRVEDPSPEGQGVKGEKVDPDKESLDRPDRAGGQQQEVLPSVQVHPGSGVWLQQVRCRRCRVEGKAGGDPVSQMNSLSEKIVENVF